MPVRRSKAWTNRRQRRRREDQERGRRLWLYWLRGIEVCAEVEAELDFAHRSPMGVLLAMRGDHRRIYDYFTTLCTAFAAAGVEEPFRPR